MTVTMWQAWAQELRRMAEAGIAGTRDPYDRERYEMLRRLAGQMTNSDGSSWTDRIDALLARDIGAITPKVDVRGAVFDPTGRVLLVREAADAGRWTLPGGWADVNLTAAEAVIKEIAEESGFEARVRKLAAVWDRTRQGHAGVPFACCKLFFVCDLVGGAATTSLETSEVGWFTEPELPQELSRGRVLPNQIRRMFEHARDPALPTDFD